MDKFRYLIPVLFVFFIAYGLFLPKLPVVNADELWETSRAYHLKTVHRPGEPIIPKEVSPFYASVEKMGWQGWFLGTAKSGSFALMMTLLPVNEWLAMRITMFLWSVFVCLLTYLLARKFNLPKLYALLAVTLLIFLPDFFSQIHRERSEILISCCLLLAVMILIKAGESEDRKLKSRYYLLSGLFAWIPSFLIHPSAIIIPAVSGLIYLIYEWKNLKSIHTLLFALGQIAGMLFFIYLMNSMKQFAVESGGGNYFNYQGPPILVRGWKYVVGIPIAFYFKFTVFNPFSRPLSFIIFIVGFLALFLGRWKYPELFSTKRFRVLVVSIFGSLAILYLLSGSFGNYNVIVAPFLCIVLAATFKRMTIRKEPYAILLSFGLVLISFASSAYYLPKQFQYAKAYDELLQKVDQVIPKQETGIMGLASYYLPFKDRRFYSNSWFNQYAGIPGQTFEEAAKKLDVHFVIVDDAFIGRAMLDRGKGWTDSMNVLLDSAYVPILETATDLYAGNRVPEKGRYPKSWIYDTFKAGQIRKVIVYKRKDLQ